MESKLGAHIRMTYGCDRLALVRVARAREAYRVSSESLHLLEVTLSIRWVSGSHDKLDDLAHQASGRSVQAGTLVTELVERSLPW